MKFNTKSRSGFTLIELLVVIGILAVLAAIAIPAVAGLIDRANVSADATNANEMTNAIERFTSEYELYCQDIASGALDLDNLDSAQGRVYNVTKVSDRAGIESLEKDSTADETTTGRAIYRDTKYPVNAETIKAIVENYTKTSSSTFDPKQSDKHFWYSPDCGIVVVDDKNATSSDLMKNVKSGKDAKGKTLDGTETWIDLTLGIASSGGVPSAGGTSHDSSIPAGAYYGNTIDMVIYEEMPPAPKLGDVYVYGDYLYMYMYVSSDGEEGWHVALATRETDLPKYIPDYPFTDKTKTSYGEILTSINNEPIKSVGWLFQYCENLQYSPTLPSTVVDIEYTYDGCKSLKEAPQIPNSVESMYYTFRDCISLTVAPRLPSSLVSMPSCFEGCINLVTPPPEIPSNVDYIHSAFLGCAKLTGTISINIREEFTMYDNVSYRYCFEGTTQPIVLTGSASQSTFDVLIATANNGNVTRK